MIEERPKLRFLPIEQLELWEEANVRKSGGLTNIEDLANNIAEIGLRVPLLVKDRKNGKYLVFSGQRRLTACKIAGLKFVPCFIFENVTLKEAQILSLSENLYRQPMNDDDISDAAFNLLQILHDRKKVALALGVSENKIKKYLGYRHIPDPIKEIVREKKITPQQAIDIYTKFPEERKAVNVAKELSLIKSKSPKAKFYHAIKTSSPLDNMQTIHHRAEKLGRMQKFEILLPDVKAKLLEKIAYKRQTTVVDILTQIIEQWTDDYERGWRSVDQ